MSENTVPKGVAILIFAVLGLLIAASIVFAVWSIRLARENFVPAMKITHDIFGEGESPVLGRLVDAEREQARVVEVHGQPVIFDGVEPATIDYTTFVPVHGVLEALGYELDWDETAGMAVFLSYENTIVITMDEQTFTLNDEEHTLEAPAQFVDEYAMFPIRAVAEILGYNVTFDAARNVIHIYYPAPEPAPLPELPPAPEAVPAPQPTPAPPRPVATPRPFVDCGTCDTTGVSTCSACEGVGGGRGLQPPAHLAHISFRVGAASDTWWCTRCDGHGTATCGTCGGEGRHR
ncbi:MAG: stalk domain-containing protein [Defluviitaleaceae bacterium]|nr:stalk domain-containing protein [Defluviitaleaceae bacterium]